MSPTQTKRLATTAATEARRANKQIKIYHFKLIHLSNKKKIKLNKTFIQAKNLSNYLLSLIKNNIVWKDIQPCQDSVPVSNKETGEIEERELTELYSLSKQKIFTRLKTNVKALSSLKKKGYEVGEIKYQSHCDCVPVYLGEGFSFRKKDHKYVRFHDKNTFYKITGYKELDKDIEKYGIGNDGIEFALSQLVSKNGSQYINLVAYIPKEEHTPTGKNMALDFGAMGDMITSEGEVVDTKIYETERLKEAQRKNQYYRDLTGHNSKTQKKIINREYEKINNIKNDIANKVVHELFNENDYVVVQDEQLQSWHKNKCWSKSLHHSIIGRILSKIKQHPRAIIVEKNVPTTKICSDCGYIIKEGIPTNIREWTCPKCGSHQHRDLNATQVMLRYAEGTGLKKLNREYCLNKSNLWNAGGTPNESSDKLSPGRFGGSQKPLSFSQR